MVLPLALAAGLVTAAPRAATIDVRVHDEHGGPFAGVVVVVAPAGGSTLRAPRRTTDPAGHAEFEGLEPGQYRLDIPGPSDAPFVRPERNPRVTLPTVTLVGPTDRVDAEIELWRGRLLVLEAVLGAAGDSSLALVRLRERSTSQGFTAYLPTDVETELRVVPGVWELALEPRPGLLLTDLAVDGQPVEGHIAVLDLDAPSAPRYVTWSLAAPAEIWGRVTYAGPPARVVISAELVEPGPWFEAAQRRGGSSFAHVDAGLRPDDTYRLQLPDGRWAVRASGDEVAAAEPDVADCVVGPGDSRRQDFLVRTSDETGRLPPILVTVVDPSGRRVDGATVEARAFDGGNEGEVAARATTGRNGQALLRDVPPGIWVVVAAHADWIEGRVPLPDYRADPDDPVRPTVRLEPGAVVHVIARDADAVPVEAVDVSLAPCGEGEPRSASTDTTGHAWIRGLRPACYRLTAALAAASPIIGAVRFEGAEETDEELRLELRPEEEREVVMRVVPAASLSGRLRCLDGSALPATVSLGAFQPVPPEEPGDAPPAVPEPDWPDVPLRGDLRDTFRVGPLEAGAFHVGLRPAGHERWTWAYGVENRGDAAVVQVASGASVDLGLIGIDCGPAILIRPLLESGEEPPDLRAVQPSYGTFTLSGVKDAVVDAYPGRIVVRDLPAGPADLTLKLTDPYFLPGPDLVVHVEATLEPGKTLALTPRLAALGGELRLRDAEAPAARVSGATGDPRIERLVQGLARFPSLPAGRYRVELCGDPGCTGPTRDRTPVDVVAGRTIEVP